MVFGLMLMYGLSFIIVIFRLWVLRMVVSDVVVMFLLSEDIMLLVMKIKGVMVVSILFGNGKW